MYKNTNHTLLCIDDDQDILNVLERIFSKADYKVYTSTDSNEAIGLIKMHDIGVVLCDYNMPDMNGVDVLSEIKERYPDTVRLLLTGETDSQLAVDAINKGAIFKFMHKSWDRGELIRMVKEAFQLFDLSRENRVLTKKLEEANEKLHETNKGLEKRVEEKAREIVKLTFYDEITELPNRTFLIEWLSQALKQAGRNNQTIGIFMLGIDRFKKINESLGHTTGDQLLRLLATKMADCTREADTICRLSGDMFCIVVQLSGSTDDTPELANRLLQGIEEPFVMGEKEVYLTASVGISLYPNDGTDLHELLRKAEIALNYAKEKGGNTYQYFTESFNKRAKHRLSLEAELHKAIRNEEFVLYYQPRVSSDTLKIVGAEALIRWQHPVRGLVSPDDFIPLLEETGLIRPVGEWVINEVITALARWQERGFTKLRASANLSPLQFKQDDLVGQIRNIASDNTYSSLLQFLELEITENILMDDIERAKRILDRLHDEGITLAIDDFGTGYSALSYLIKLPIDHIKIDISFVRQMGISHDADAVIRAIVLLAQSLRLKSIAEGVETEMQSQALHILGCDEFQGFLYGKPVPEEQFLAAYENEVVVTVEGNSNITKDPAQEKRQVIDVVTGR